MLIIIIIINKNKNFFINKLTTSKVLDFYTIHESQPYFHSNIIQFHITIYYDEMFPYHEINYC